MGFAEIFHGGMNGKPVCIPNNIRDFFLIILYPPLYVFLSEMYTEGHVFNISNVIISVILTCMFYFPGVIHAMTIVRERGPIKRGSTKIEDSELTTDRSEDSKSEHDFSVTEDE